MAQVTIYTRNFCGYCSAAVSLLTKKGVEFKEIDAGSDPAMRQEMIQKSNGGATYPQIFIGSEHIGGCDEMMALERSGALDAMLAS